jgi:hypothetical protein
MSEMGHERRFGDVRSTSANVATPDFRRNQPKSARCAKTGVSSCTVRSSPQSNIKLMPEKEVFDFKPAPAT